MEQNKPQQEEISMRSMLMVVLWPAFLMACVGTGVFFSLIDPMELIVLDERLQVHMLGAYTIGFLMFWVLGIFSSWLTALLLQKIR
ncbi:hypothetical protein H8K52_15420 [Undibacterium seohonense]|uniref:Transmembrane protein n=1 Tax=Undibacterium seohonense TaxID=1344950 RepID=A0ABR6X845_9BURK|nr:hypothetical protein [Undibacterium seohonense]MBC3808735.1 hypothetical protein [Undibacterium seohonense]